VAEISGIIKATDDSYETQQATYIVSAYAATVPCARFDLANEHNRSDAWRHPERGPLPDWFLKPEEEIVYMPDQTALDAWALGRSMARLMVGSGVLGLMPGGSGRLPGDRVVCVSDVSEMAYIDPSRAYQGVAV
jgi:hypothetical protein